MVKNNKPTDSVTDNTATNSSRCTGGKSGYQILFSKIENQLSVFKFIFSLVQFKCFCLKAFFKASERLLVD